MSLRIIHLERRLDDYGVYSSRERGPFDTSLVKRGTLEECLDYRRERDARRTAP